MTLQIRSRSPKIVSEYDQEIPQSQTADNPVAPRGRAKTNFPLFIKIIYARLVKINELVQNIIHRKPILDILKSRCDLKN